MADLPRPLPPPNWRDRVALMVERWRALPGSVAIAAVVAALVALGAGTGLALTGGLGLGRPSGPPPELTMPRAGTGDAAGADGTAGPSPSTSAPARLRVHAAGAVARPGVVEIDGGARVADVIHAAGGPSAEADLDQVNLAAPVADGERVYVPRRGETIAPTAAGGAASAAKVVVNLNQATQADLESLPGVGPATAQAILDYRTQHRRFRSIDDLLNVRGIGPAKLAQIRPRVRV